MKPTTQSMLIILAAAGISSVNAMPASASITSAAEIAQATKAASDADIAPHTADNAPAVNPGYAPDSAAQAAAAESKKCIKITSDNPNWHFANTGVWGTKTGTIGSANGEICVPHNDNAGGAMYIGSEANPQGGNTKLECYFPSGGKGNCDVSLVDGYSLSVACHTGGHTIGGATDLWKTGKACADKSREGEGICLNDKGYAAKQSDVTPFFQQGIHGNDNYCIWVNCKQDYYFAHDADVTCHVSGSKGPGN